MIKTISVQGFTPHAKQKEIINACLDDNVKYIIANCGRQVGKSFLGINIILKWLLEDNANAKEK